jgi:hypothetical protein
VAIGSAKQPPSMGYEGYVMRVSTLFRPTMLAAALVAGCRDVTAPDPKRSDLEANRQKWAQRGYTNYTFTLRMDCFCAINGPVSVLVIADSARQVTLQSTGAVIDAPWIPTIKKLFDVIDQEIARPAAVLRVTYDPTLGYPSKIVSDPIANAVDDEITYTVTGVFRLPVDPPGATTGNASRADYGIAPAAPARLGSAPAMTRPLSIFTAAP